MSTLWTPGGEHRVQRSDAVPATDAADAPSPSLSADIDEPTLSAEEQAKLADAAEEVAAARAQLAAAPASYVVANHVMGLYELAAIHLSQDPPNLSEARLAIDALVAVLEACKGRLADAEPTLLGARSQLQLAFVEVASRASDA